MRPGNESADQNGRSFIEAARRDQIVQAAIDTLADVGYGQASFARIAQQAGISAGLISYHFENKRALFQQVVTDVNTAMDAWLTERVRHARSYREALRVLIEQVVHFCATHRREVLALGQVLAGAGGQENRDLATGQRDLSIGQFEQMLAEGQQHGEFREFSPRLMAVTLMAALDAVPVELLRHPGTDVDQYAKELAMTFDLAVRRPRLGRVSRG